MSQNSKKNFHQSVTFFLFLPFCFYFLINIQLFMIKHNNLKMSYIQQSHLSNHSFLIFANIHIFFYSAKKIVNLH